MAVSLSHALPWPLALFLAFLGGLLAGFVTSLIHTRLKIPDLLSGILTMTMLYSINLRVMGNRAFVSLLRVPSLFSAGAPTGFLPQRVVIVLQCFAAVFVIKIILDLFFHTDFGLALGALGSNPQLVISQGMNPDVLKTCGISLANGLVGISGALAAMYQSFADVNLGSGMIVSGLASLMIGEFLIRSNKIMVLTLRAVLGSILYRALMYLARNYGSYIHMTSNDLKLITGLLIILCIVVSRHGFRSSGKARPKNKNPPPENSGAVENLSDFIKTKPFERSPGKNI
jgi:putative ABC transport system permease protein